jgi:hypothetical protein
VTNLAQEEEIHQLRAVNERLRQRLGVAEADLTRAEELLDGYPLDRAPAFPASAKQVIDQKNRALQEMQHRLDVAEGRDTVRVGRSR